MVESEVFIATEFTARLDNLTSSNAAIVNMLGKPGGLIDDNRDSTIPPR